MSRKKMMLLLILTAGVLLLSILLVILTLAQSQNKNQGIALFGVSTEEIDQLSYSGSNVEVTMLKGTEGNWLMESDPTLPLDQEIVASLVEKNCQSYGTAPASGRRTGGNSGSE